MTLTLKGRHTPLTWVSSAYRCVAMPVGWGRRIIVELWVDLRLVHIRSTISAMILPANMHTQWTAAATKRILRHTAQQTGDEWPHRHSTGTVPRRTSATVRTQCECFLSSTLRSTFPLYTFDIQPSIDWAALVIFVQLWINDLCVWYNHGEYSGYVQLTTHHCLPLIHLTEGARVLPRHAVSVHFALDRRKRIDREIR